MRLPSLGLNVRGHAQKVIRWQLGRERVSGAILASENEKENVLGNVPTRASEGLISAPPHPCAGMKYRFRITLVQIGQGRMSLPRYGRDASTWWRWFSHASFCCRGWINAAIFSLGGLDTHRFD